MPLIRFPAALRQLSLPGFVRRARYRRLLLLLLPVLIFWLLHLLFPLPLAHISYSQVITAEDGTVLNAFLSHDDKWRMKLELHEITPEIEKTFLAKEDKYFYYHPGVNLLAVLRAAFNNLTRGKTTSGASTITMQVARLLEPKARSYSSKLIEMFRALQLEITFSKKEILQLYLNLVPYGGNLEGVKAASLLYFGRMPERLSLAQVCALTVIPNRPNSLALGKNNAAIEAERRRWLNRFREEAVFSPQQIADALNEPLEAQRRPVPTLAPHFARFIHQQQQTQANVRSTLQAALQDKVEQISLAYSQRLRAFNINNASVLVVENKSGNILAYLGSPDFGDARNGGQVDGVRAYRSPGSTLKPLIYGLAFDKGLITPKSILHDVPIDVFGYAPENYDKKFHGPVSAEQALATSLNIPAVQLLDELGVATLIEVLKKINFRSIKQEEKKLGLSLALGGCGVSLFEMAGLYAAIANRGQFRPLQMLPGDSSARPMPLISASAAFILTDMLSRIERPGEMPGDYLSNPHLPKIAWKTGTSYGRRDAWSIGFNKKYTIAVWLGNFTGEGSPELTGAGVATPLLFKLFNDIDYNSSNQWFSQPDEIKTRMVCAESGLAPEEFCTKMVSDYFVPGLSPSRRCSCSRYLFVSADERFAYCSHCLPENGYKRKLYPNLSPDIISYNETHQVNYVKWPPHHPACTYIASDEQAPVISSPVNRREYFTEGDQGVELMLKCDAASDVKQVYWYINNQFYKSARASAGVFFKPPQGEVKISCSDDQGRNSNIFIIVR